MHFNASRCLVALTVAAGSIAAHAQTAPAGADSALDSVMKAGVLRELEILVDGSAPHKYLLQIFLRESAGLYGEREAGPFFYEIIQRKGDQGFGGGNFRALFESIEREQRRAGRL